MKLIGSYTSPFVRKIHIALLEKNLCFDFHECSPWLPDSDIKAYNPLGKVPALVDDQGQTWVDSAVIVEYLETLDATPSLVPKPPRQAVQTRQLEALADGVCDAGVALFLEMNRSDSEQSAKWIARQETKLEEGVEYLSQLLGERQYLGGDALSIADIALVTTLDWLDFRMPKYNIKSRYPNIEALCIRLNARASFANTVPK